ncbi:STAS/SEC14 domain-containing protein [Hymenobacter siberiensis]|uniref:STAS/SEC14 domain-containing protein n=1 Tax=Hymenobacter siberiensis TaxID=2848396 RepID=UPI001C1DF35A|nr:STAS/SEC14 domain-containing protein [Hymenobacter siberiensis]
MLTAEAVHLTTIADCYGAPLAEYYFFPDHSLLYISWHGQLTAAEVIRGVLEGTRLLEKHAFQRILNDKRDTGGDWSEALPWLEYEWMPKAVAAGLRAIAYILSPNLDAQIVSHKFVEAVQGQIQISLFTNEEDAREWLEIQ